MKLSIITVNLNNRDGLKRTIDSVVSQTFRDFEWIVIDGGSTDGSKELIEEYADHFAYWCSEPDKGIYNAMNKGVSHARGEYCQFLNSGDWLAGNNVYEEVFCHNLEADVCYGNIKRYSRDGFIDNFIYAQNLSLLYLFEQSLGHNSTFIKRQVLMDFPYDESLRIVADWKFFLEAAIHNKSFTKIELFVGCFDMTGISSMNEDLVEAERQRVINELCPTLLQNDISKRKQLEIALAHTRIEDFLTIRRSCGLCGKVLTLLLVFMKKLYNSNV